MQSWIMESKAVLMSEGSVEPLFQLLVHKVTIEKFDLLRDLGMLRQTTFLYALLHHLALAKNKGLPDCSEDSEGSQAVSES